MTFDNKTQVNQNQNQNQHQNQNQNQNQHQNQNQNQQNNNNNQNNSNNNTPQKNSNQGTLNLDFDKIYAEKYNNSGFQNQNQLFQNPNQFPQQQINPQFLQMVMSNPQLFNQFMQTCMQKQQQQQMGNFGGGNMPPNFGNQMMGNQQINMQNHSNNEFGNPIEEKQKDMFKDILSYSENKQKNNGKVENFNPFV